MMRRLVVDSPLNASANHRSHFRVSHFADYPNPELTAPEIRVHSGFMNLRPPKFGGIATVIKNGDLCHIADLNLSPC